LLYLDPLQGLVEDQEYAPHTSGRLCAGTTDNLADVSMTMT